MAAARIDILITDTQAPKDEVSRLRNKGVDIRLV